MFLFIYFTCYTWGSMVMQQVTMPPVLVLPVTLWSFVCSSCVFSPLTKYFRRLICSGSVFLVFTFCSLIIIWCIPSCIPFWIVCLWLNFVSLLTCSHLCQVCQSIMNFFLLITVFCGFFKKSPDMPTSTPPNSCKLFQKCNVGNIVNVFISLLKCSKSSITIEIMSWLWWIIHFNVYKSKSRLPKHKFWILVWPSQCCQLTKRRLTKRGEGIRGAFSFFHTKARANLCNQL